MAIRILSLAQAYPGSGFDTNEVVSSCLASSGSEFLKIAKVMQERNRAGGEGVRSCVLLSSLHQSIEMLAKALIVRTDINALPKQLGHRTLRNMKSYRQTIKVFDNILTHAEKEDLIRQLERAYLTSRYGEDFTYHEGRDIEMSIEIAEELQAAYYYPECYDETWIIYRQIQKHDMQIINDESARS